MAPDDTHELTDSTVGLAVHYRIDPGYLEELSEHAERVVGDDVPDGIEYAVHSASVVEEAPVRGTDPVRIEVEVVFPAVASPDDLPERAELFPEAVGMTTLAFVGGSGK